MKLVLPPGAQLEAALLTGSVPFANSLGQLAQDNASFNFDDTTNTLTVENIAALAFNVINLEVTNVTANTGTIVVTGSVITDSGFDIGADGAVYANTGFYVGDITGTATGGMILLNRQVFVVSGTYTPTGLTRAVLVRMIAGGGGGGGGASGAGISPAGGGAAGAYFEKWIDPSAAITGGAVTIGAAGAGGAAGNNTGTTGGDSSIVIQGTTYTAKGGLGGTGAINFSGAGFITGGLGVAGSSAGDIVTPGGPGHYGISLGTPTGTAGDGSNSQWGGGGRGAQGVDANGSAAVGYGAGGGGGMGAATTSAGGAGTIGLIIVEEYG